MAAAERRLGPYWSMTRSQVYRELPVLAEQGYVRLGKPGPRSSQPYAITAAGQARVHPVAQRSRPAATRCVTRSPCGSPSAAALRHPAQGALLHGANEYHTEALAMAREQAKEAKKAGDAYGAAALEFAVAYHKAALSWLKAAPTR